MSDGEDGIVRVKQQSHLFQNNSIFLFLFLTLLMRHYQLFNSLFTSDIYIHCVSIRFKARNDIF